MPSPDLNLQLILLFCYSTNVLLAVLIGVAAGGFPGSWLWVGGQGLLAVGTLLDAYTPGGQVWIPLVIGNSAYVVSSLVFLHSVWSFRYPTRFPRGLYALAVVVVLSFALVVDQPYWIRAAVFAAWEVAGPLATGVCLVWGVERNYRLAHWLTAAPFVILGGASLVRLFLVILAADQEGFLAPLNVWYVSGAVLLGNIVLFGYFMMARTRSEQRLDQKDRLIDARNQKLIESNRSKDLFFSIIAHDLRGPIGGAARYVRKHLLGKMSGLEAKYAEVETLASALDKTNEFLEKLLWWSRAQLEDWAPSRVAVDLAQTLGQVVDLHRAAADLKEITLEVSPPPYPPPWADPESVQLIVGNLVSNAIKFSLPGRRVKITVTAGAQRCLVTVEDEGVGMDQRTIDRLFRIEDKLSTHGTSGERGSGLGLLLARSLARRNDGDVEIASEPGEGTRATLWLPRSQRET